MLKFRNRGRHRQLDDRQEHVVMYVVLYWTPRGRPDGRVTWMDLEGWVGAELLFNLQDEGPENRFCTCAMSCPERGVRIVFSFEYIWKHSFFCEWLHSKQPGWVSSCWLNGGLWYPILYFPLADRCHPKICRQWVQLGCPPVLRSTKTS
jgi:hypothetical protein